MRCLPLTPPSTVCMLCHMQAMSFDDGSVYKERLEVAFHKLKLRAELYQQPEEAEHQAGMIIEPVCTRPA